MKTTKITQNAKVLLTFLSFACAAWLFTACDVTETDPDVLNPDADFSTDEVYVMGTGASVIDLNSIVHASMPVRVAVTETTRKGELTDLGNGLLRYAPSQDGRTRDSFGVTVYSEANEVIATDSVVIVIEVDSTALPCAIYPVADFVELSSREDLPLINVMANDVFCDHDAWIIELSIHSPGSGAAPFFGTAEVVNNHIVYHPGPSFTTSDIIVYKITASDGTVVYGLVYISLATPCQIRAVDDLFTLVYRDSIDSMSYARMGWAPVFANDELCGHLKSALNIRISRGPDWGEATIDSTGITYFPPAMVPGQQHADSLQYEICKGAVCEQATVRLVIIKEE